MVFPALTAFYGGWLGLLFLVLSIGVTIGRARFKTHHGDGGHVPLQRWIRSQANFAEYVPLALLLIGLDEAGGVAPWIIRALLIALLVARLVHPVGMLTAAGSRLQYALRAPAATVTWVVLLIAAVMLLVR